MLRVPSKRNIILIVVLIILLIGMAVWWSQLINAMLPVDSRPANLEYPAAEGGASAIHEAKSHLQSHFPEQLAESDRLFAAVV